MSSCPGPGCTDPSHDKERLPDVVEHEKAPTGPRVTNKTPYETGTVYRSRTGVRYRADEKGTLHRVDGPKLSKAERKAAKREAMLELNRGRSVGRSPDS